MDHTNAYTRYLENPSLNTSRLILNQIDTGKGDIVLHIGESSLWPNIMVCSFDVSQVTLVMLMVTVLNGMSSSIKLSR